MLMPACARLERSDGTFAERAPLHRGATQGMRPQMMCGGAEECATVATPPSRPSLARGVPSAGWNPRSAHEEILTTRSVAMSTTRRRVGGMDDTTIGAAVAASIDAVGFSRDDVARAAHMDPSALSSSIKGERAFKFLELAWIASHLGMGVDELTGRQTLPFMAAARAAAGTNAHRDEEIRDVARLMFERRRGLHDLKIGAPASLPAVSARDRDDVTAQKIVAALRKQVGHSSVLRSIDELATAIEQAFGIDVWVRSLPKGIDGYSIHSVNDGVYGMVVSSNISAQRMRMTIAHELAHLVLADDTTNQPHNIEDDANSATEKRATRIAGLILMPKDKVPDKDPWDRGAILTVAAGFYVAPNALAARVNAGIYEPGSLEEAFRYCRRDPQEHATWQAESRQERRPTRLLHDLAVAYTSGESTVRPFALLAGIDDLDEAKAAARGLIEATAA